MISKKTIILFLLLTILTAIAITWFSLSGGSNTELIKVHYSDKQERPLLELLSPENLDREIEEERKKTKSNVNEYESEQTRNYLIDLCGKSDQLRMKALSELSLKIKKKEVKDFPLKNQIFIALFKNTQNTDILAQCILLLTELPADEEVIKIVQQILDSSKNDDAHKSIALLYLFIHNHSLFNSYFVDREFSDIPEPIKTRFNHTSILQKLRDQYFDDLIVKMRTSNFEKEPIIADVPSMESTELLKGKTFFPDYINRNEKKYMAPELDLNIVWFLGEIASFESFDILLKNFLIKKHPNMRDAFALSACTGSLQLDILFRKLTEANRWELFLDFVMPKEDLIKIKTLSTKDQLQYLIEHYNRLRKYFCDRSIPQLG